MTTREILTLQCGPYSNFIGAHFWNIQDKDLVYEPRPVIPLTNPAVLYREGLSLNREETFTPRLISVDLKGGLGTLPRYGELYRLDEGEGEETPIWDGDVRKENRGEIHEKDVDESEDLLKTNFEFWSDYLNPRLHPNSNIVLEEYQKDNALKPFDIFGLGTASDENAEEDIFESVRFFAEETDHMSGFHCISDADSGFGGLSFRIKDHLLDEYPRKSILSFPVWPSFYDDSSEIPSNPLRNPSRFLNIALSLYYLHEASLLTPLSMNPGYFPLPRKPNSIPGINVDHESLYQTSALLASSLDNVTLPWRLKLDPASTYEFVDVLSQRGRKFCALSACMPLKNEEPRFFSLMPGFEFSPNSKILIQTAIQRGTNTEFNLEEYLQTHFRRSFNSLKVIKDEGSPVGSPYPQIFESPMERANMITSWSSTNAMEKILNSIANQVEKLNLNKLNRFLEAGLEEDELKEVAHGYMSLAEDYSEHQDM